MEILNNHRKSLQHARANSAGFVMVNSKKIKVAWLGPYPSGLLQREVTIVRSYKADPASWIVNLANALAKRQDIDPQVITASSGIFENHTVSKDGITFQVIRHTSTV